MKVFVISLVRAVERRARFASNDLSGIDYSFFDAVDAAAGEHLGISGYDEEKTLRRFGAPLTPGEIACYASHYRLWERCVDLGAPIAIMEDDVWVSSRFPETLQLANVLVESHRFIRLAGLKMPRFRLLQDLVPPLQLVSFLAPPRGAQCYCISPSGAEALLAAAEEWIEPVDLYMDCPWKHGLAPKGIVPFQAEEVDRSDVASMIGDRRHKRTGLGKLQREFGRAHDRIAMTLFTLRHPRS